MDRFCRFLTLACLGLALSMVTNADANGLNAVQITEFPVPTVNSGPAFITVGRDGALWFTEELANKIGRITVAGHITEFSIPTIKSGAWGIVAGPDGNIWFTEALANNIGKITPSGEIQEFAVPGVHVSGPNGVETMSGRPQHITVGRDGNLWFVQSVGGLGRITTSGIVNEYLIPTPWNDGSDIATGRDGNLWLTGVTVLGIKIFRVTTARIFTTFGESSGSTVPFSGITAGSDGNMWFTNLQMSPKTHSQISRISMEGMITHFDLPLEYPSVAGEVTGGPDGNLWFAESDANKIGVIAPKGGLSAVNIPTAKSGPLGITSGSGYVWFTESKANKIGRIRVALTRKN